MNLIDNISEGLTITDAVLAGIPVGMAYDGTFVTIPSEPHGRCDHGHGLESIGGKVLCPECDAA